MNPTEDTHHGEHPSGWLQSRYGFAVFFFASLLLGFSVLRLALVARIAPELDAPIRDYLVALVIGLYRDLLPALLSVLPLLIWFLLAPDRWFAKRWHRALLVGGLFLFWLVQLFLFAAEFFFFEKFESRFNTVAVDYLLYPHEVFFNIWDEYPVAIFLGVCALLGGGWLWVALKWFRPMWRTTVPRARRFAWLAAAVATGALLAATINLQGVRFSRERAVNEIANNGALSFVFAAWTRHLDFEPFYRTIPMDEAYERVRRMVSGDGVQFVSDARSVRRQVAGDPERPRLNVVMLVEESLGAEFFGCLGREQETVTPEMDKLAADEGLLFSNIYATGNRTVRGLEGVLSSFPPLPGDSIIWRDRSRNVETLARVLKRDDYATLFLYGGRGLFDRMDGFALDNGFDRFIEQKDFENPVFSTVWGVSDEDLFGRAIEEFRRLHEQRKPFFAVALTVSNHEPFTYPEGRIPEDPAARKREHAVKYSDYALGSFFRQVKEEPFYENTIFVMVADHGDRVYGSQTIPIPSYMIPLLIVGPAAVKAPARVSGLGCSMDVPPTILGLIGRPYESMFLGRDLLAGSPGEGRAFLQHNRDIGQYARERLVVLGLNQTVEYYRGDPKLTEPESADDPTPAELELERDTISMYQVADDLYVNERYRIDEE